MDSTDIPEEVFSSVFLFPQRCNRDTLKLVTEWNQSYDPSFNIVKSQFRKFAQKNSKNAQSLCADVTRSLQILSDNKSPKNFMRGYLATIKTILQAGESEARNMLLLKVNQYRNRWQQVHLDILEPYFQAFSLKTSISQEQLNTFIQQLIVSKKYNNCLDFIKYLGVEQNKENIEKLMSKMSNKRDASKAADYVKRLNLDPKNYPALGQRLYKNTARHFLSKHGWEYSEQIFQDYPQALACIVEDLLFKNKIAQARSIWARHPLWEYLQKEESKVLLKQQYEGELPKNYIMEGDVFGPPDCQRYISLSDFGIKQEDVIWVDEQTQNLDDILSDIRNAEFLGIDTESIVGQTKFQKVQEAALIQVSTGKKVYMFDGFKSRSEKIGQTFIKCFEDKKIIGHSFTNDTEGILKGFGMPVQQIQIKNLIDICKVYKGLNENAKYSSLAHISKQVIGKQLCKDQTLTNWRRRPLRKNQLHYAALDAQIVVQIYVKWVKEYGMIVHYHAQMDDDS